jgi:hypothetical protein
MYASPRNGFQLRVVNVRVLGLFSNSLPVLSSTQNRPFVNEALSSKFINVGFERSCGHFGFGPINKCLEAPTLDTGFRHLLALNGRNFGINAHLAANPTLRHQLKGPKPEGGVI